MNRSEFSCRYGKNQRAKTTGKPASFNRQTRTDRGSASRSATPKQDVASMNSSQYAPLLLITDPRSALEANPRACQPSIHLTESSGLRRSIAMSAPYEALTAGVVAALRKTLGANLYSCCVYGSAVRGNWIEA
jgi:hypothetical protein